MKNVAISTRYPNLGYEPGIYTTTGVTPMLGSARQIPRLEFSFQQQNISPTRCKLQWRQGQLLVSSYQDFKQPYLPALDCEQRLVECLKHSPVHLVRIDPNLGEAVLKRWADACEQANKPLFLQKTAAQKLTNKPSKLLWIINRVIDWIMALVLLIGLGPVMLAIAVIIFVNTRKPIFSLTWRVGLRGKFFRAIKFHTTVSNDDAPTTQLKHWLHKYRLDEMPQLVNVLRGEMEMPQLVNVLRGQMSLLGSYPLTLSEVVRLS